MKDITFTQTITVILTIDAEVPDDWTNDDIRSFAEEAATSITIDAIDDEWVAEGANITGLSVDNSGTVSAVVKKGLNANG